MSESSLSQQHERRLQPHVILSRMANHHPGNSPVRIREAGATVSSEFLSTGRNFHNLIDALVLRHFKVVLLGNEWGHKACRGQHEACWPFRGIQGMKVLPKPDLGGPSSMSHEDGASTDVTGKLVSSSDLMT